MPTLSAVNQHISQTATCRQAWEKELTSRGRQPSRRSTTTNAGSTPASDPESDTLDVEMENAGEDFEPQVHEPPTPPEVLLPEPAPRKRRRVEIEEVEDVDDPRKQTRWAQSYPGNVATPLRQEKTRFEAWHEAQSVEGKSEWAPFDSQEEWDLAQWLMKNVGQKSIDQYLKLPIVSVPFRILQRFKILPFFRSKNVAVYPSTTHTPS